MCVIQLSVFTSACTHSDSVNTPPAEILIIFINYNKHRVSLINWLLTPVCGHTVWAGADNERDLS